MTLNPSTMRLGIASILVGLVGAYGVRHMMEEEEVPVEEKVPKEYQVPVASGSLPAGRVIRKGDIGFLRLKEADMSERGYNTAELMMDPDQIVGRELKRPLRAGSPFLTSEVYLEGLGEGFSVAKGMRMVQVQIGADRGGMNAYRGDTVDVYFTSEPQSARAGKPEIPEKTINVVEGVRILNVDYPNSDNGRWSPGRDNDVPIFSLEVDPVTAGKVTALKDYGDFAVIVRAGDEPAGRSKGEGEFTVADLLGIEEPVEPTPPPVHSVEYWKRGQKFYKHFPLPQPTQDQLAQQQPRVAPPQPVADVLPGNSSPTPAAQPQRPQSPPPIPYRPSPSPSSVSPPTPPTPSVDPPVPPSISVDGGSVDPFTDDPQPTPEVGEILP